MGFRNFIEKLFFFCCCYKEQYYGLSDEEIDKLMKQYECYTKPLTLPSVEQGQKIEIQYV